MNTNVYPVYKEDVLQGSVGEVLLEMAGEESIREVTGITLTSGISEDGSTIELLLTTNLESVMKRQELTMKACHQSCRVIQYISLVLWNSGATREHMLSLKHNVGAPSRHWQSIIASLTPQHLIFRSIARKPSNRRNSAKPFSWYPAQHRIPVLNPNFPIIIKYP